MAEGREGPARSFLSISWRGDGKPGEFRKWLSANGSVLFMLTLLFFLALFVRGYFGYELSADNDYIVSGGSDSYYWEHIIHFNAETGKQLYWDPMTNFPDGSRNPRPPFYSFSIAVPAVIAQDLFSSLDDSIGWMLIWSTAFWGALTVIPTYFLGKEAFGRRTGLVAAFLLAIMPSHVQRSVLSNADHDSFILFFIVLTFYFLLRAVKSQQHKRWVENWRSFSSIRSGLRDYFKNSRTALLYSLMAGTSFGCILIAWVGFGYVAVIILAYYLVQILFNKFRNVDSTSVTLIVLIVMGLGYLLAFPVYYEQTLIPVRFDVPVYLLLIAVAFGMMFVVTRDIPWTLSFPVIGAIAVIGLVVISIFNPALSDAVLSGQGYFSKSKLYSTIAEAQAPGFSELAMGFGMVTFFLSLVGLFWAIIKLPKSTTADHILLVVWLGAAIFMAISAARFMFNAAPAFALSAAWIVVIIVDGLNFNSVRRSLFGASGSYWHVLKKSVKIRHVVGALFLAWMIVFTNTWYGMDAGIPQEVKASYDKDVYFSIPEFLRPPGYDEINGSYWYLGAFGYSMPLPNQYFPAAWSWFRQQDSDIMPESDRPAYTAWWDYGFEAIQEGEHPTVADNFQQGYQVTGNLIVAQSEDEAIAIYAYRLIEAAFRDGGVVEDRLIALFEKYGLDPERMSDIIDGPAAPLISEILGNPAKFGPMAEDMSAVNARIVAARTELTTSLSLEELVSFYDEACDITGWEIRYFNVDSRMFPLTASSTGIYYAPAKLADRRIEGNSLPIDFFVIYAVTSSGAEIPIDEVTADDQIVDYSVSYKDRFYDSMFYRAMVGFSPSDIGLQDEGIPGYSGPLQNADALPGWNMSHFRLVYRTAYYNPYPTDEIYLHREAWTAVNYDEAIALQQQISDGLITGAVDASARSMYTAGLVFLKYYHGAYVNGTLTTDEGYPISGATVTVLDEFSIPHNVSFTGPDGSYSVLAPFGNVTVVFSTGDFTDQTLQGSSKITSMSFDVTDAQAMRLPYDLNGDGLFDYEITKDVSVQSSVVQADIYWDMNSDNNYTVGSDELIKNSVMYATDLYNGRVYVFDAADGSAEGRLGPGTYMFSALVEGRNLTVAQVYNVSQGLAATIGLPLLPGRVTGTLILPDGSPSAGTSVVLKQDLTGYEYSAMTNATGVFSLNKVLAGNYTMLTHDEGKILFDITAFVPESDALEISEVVQERVSLRARVLKDGVPVASAVCSITDRYNPARSASGLTDQYGYIQFYVPEGEWTLYATYFDGSATTAGAKTITATAPESPDAIITLSAATDLKGSVRTPTNTIASFEFVCFEAVDGTRIYSSSDVFGTYAIRLPYGTYNVTASSISRSGVYSGSVQLASNLADYQVRMSSSAVVEGTLMLGTDVTLGLESAVLGRIAPIVVTDSDGFTYTSTTRANGSFSLSLPKAKSLTLALGLDGYSDFEQSLQFSDDQEGAILYAPPDEVVVSGRITLDGEGLRGVTVSIAQEANPLSGVDVASGAGGYFTVVLPATTYTVNVNQDTSLVGGERYVNSSTLQVLPSGTPLSLEVKVVKKVELSGAIHGGGTQTEVRLSGPETITINTTTGTYSAWVLPGLYQVYAKSQVSYVYHANMSSVEVSYASRTLDIELVRAYYLTGTVTIESGSVTRQVTVTATSQYGNVVSVLSTNKGQYSVNLPPGTYDVQYVLETTLRVGDEILYVEYSRSEVAAISAGDVALSPVMELHLDNTTLSGAVYDSSGSPVQATVELVNIGGFGKSVTFVTEPTGSFFESIQPGDYNAYITSAESGDVAFEEIAITRNVPKEVRIDMSSGNYLSGHLTVGGSGASLPLSIAKGPLKLTVQTGEDGRFSKLLPSADYVLSTSTTLVENGLDVTYTLGVSVTISGEDEVVDLPMTRDTRRSLETTWNTNLTQTALPETTVTYVFNVENTGNIEDTYSLSFSGSTNDFQVVLNPTELTLGFGSNNFGAVEVQITPTSDARAGNTRIPVTLRSENASSVRSEVSLYVNVGIVRGVTIYSNNVTTPVSSRTAFNMFSLNNTGNSQDDIAVQIANQATLNSLGWKAEIYDSGTNETISNATIAAFHSTPLEMRFIALRSNPDPDAVAVVLAYSKSSPSVSYYGEVPIMLPDLALGHGDVDATRDDVTYEYDIGRVYLDLGLVVALVALVIILFFLRRKKGLGGGAKK